MDNQLQQGIEAFRSGRRDEARKIFLSIVKQDPSNERAWGWLYNVCNNDQERTYCLKQILRINPNNQKAKQLLENMTFSQTIKDAVHRPAQPIVPGSQHQSVEYPKTLWYRSKLAYLLFFVFITPLWSLLILTDKKQGIAVKILAGVVATGYIGYCCILTPLSIITQENLSSAKSYVQIQDNWICYPNTIGDIIFEGAVFNSGDRDITLVTLRVRLLDEANRVISTSTGLIDSDILYSGGISMFKIYTTNPNIYPYKCEVEVENALFK